MRRKARSMREICATSSWGLRLVRVVRFRLSACTSHAKICTKAGQFVLVSAADPRLRVSLRTEQRVDLSAVARTVIESNLGTASTSRSREMAGEAEIAVL